MSPSKGMTQLLHSHSTERSLWVKMKAQKSCSLFYSKDPKVCRFVLSDSHQWSDPCVSGPIPGEYEERINSLCKDTNVFDSSCWVFFPPLIHAALHAHTAWGTSQETTVGFASVPCLGKVSRRPPSSLIEAQQCSVMQVCVLIKVRILFWTLQIVFTRFVKDGRSSALLRNVSELVRAAQMLCP